MKYKMSIIIPVYNTERYIEKCLDSIINQTLKDIEIIIIDDGSTDNSYKIIKKYMKYENVKIVSKKNEGQGVARNVGLNICTGDYIGFVDSDDYIELDMFEKMYNKAIGENLDIVICNYRYVYDNTDKYINPKITLDNNNIIGQKECIKRFLTTNTIEGFSWNKIFKRNLFFDNKISYPQNMKYEDIPTVVNLLVNSNRIGFLNDRFYNYLLRENSTTSINSINNDIDYINAIQMVKDIVLRKHSDLETEVMYYYFNSINILYGVIKKYKSEINQYNNIIGVYKKINSNKPLKKILFNNYLSLNKKNKLILKLIIIKFYIKKMSKE